MVKITEDLTVPERELTFTFSRSGKPGGQNVNKVSTRVTLWFDLASSPSLTEHQRERIRTGLSTRINKAGVLRVVALRHRTQAANREAAIERFAQLLREALAEAKPRLRTSVSRASRQRRLAEKRRRGWLKKQRSQRIRSEE